VFRPIGNGICCIFILCSHPSHFLTSDLLIIAFYLRESLRTSLFRQRDGEW
jgi:hypothetical protein